MAGVQLPVAGGHKLEGHEGAVMAVRFNADGNYCITGGRDRTVRLWNPSNQFLMKTYTGHTADVNDVVGFPDNSKIVSGGKDRTVLVCDVSSGGVLRKFRGHVESVNRVKVNKLMSIILSASYDASVRLWDVKSHNKDPLQVLDEAKDSVSGLDVSDNEIVTGSVDGYVRTYDLRMGQMRVDYIGEPITSVSFSHDFNCILISSLDSTVRLLDKETGELLQDYNGHVSKDYKVESCLSYHDAYVMSGSEDGKILFWDLVEGKPLKTIKAHSSVVCCLSSHPKKNQLLSSAVDGTVKIWG